MSASVPHTDSPVSSSDALTEDILAHEAGSDRNHSWGSYHPARLHDTASSEIVAEATDSPAEVLSAADAVPAPAAETVPAEAGSGNSVVFRWQPRVHTSSADGIVSALPAQQSAALDLAQQKATRNGIVSDSSSVVHDVLSHETGSAQTRAWGNLQNVSGRVFGQTGNAARYAADMDSPAASDDETARAAFARNRNLADKGISASKTALSKTAAPLRRKASARMRSMASPAYKAQTMAQRSARKAIRRNIQKQLEKRAAKTGIRSAAAASRAAGKGAAAGIAAAAGTAAAGPVGGILVTLASVCVCAILMIFALSLCSSLVTSETDSDISPTELNVMAYLLAQDYSNEAIAGIMGNLSKDGYFETHHPGEYEIDLSDYHATALPELEGYSFGTDDLPSRAEFKDIDSLSIAAWAYMVAYDKPAEMTGAQLSDRIAKSRRYLSILRLGYYETQLTILKTAYESLGCAYVWGALNPGVSFDCSGLTKYCYQQAGITIPKYSGSQKNALSKHFVLAAQPADILWNDHHVAVYLGDGWYIHARDEAHGVCFGQGTDSFFWALRYEE